MPFIQLSLYSALVVINDIFTSASDEMLRKPALVCSKISDGLEETMGGTSGAVRYRKSLFVWALSCTPLHQVASIRIARRISRIVHLDSNGCEYNIEYIYNIISEYILLKANAGGDMSLEPVTFQLQVKRSNQ